MTVRSGPRLGALGLGGRIVGVVLVSTVATLAVAAVALLGPLEQSLRNAEKKTLESATRGATANFTKLTLTYVADAGVSVSPASPEYGYHREGLREQRVLREQEQSLGQRIGAVVELLGYFDARGHGQVLAPAPGTDTTEGADRFDDASRAFMTGSRIYSFGSIQGTEFARAAIPVTIGGQRYVLSVRRPIDEIPAAVNAVRTAFLTAALAGLGLALILGIPLSATLVRRLRRLRQAALRLAEEGPAVEVPVDRARDEVGDLTRTFASMQRQLRRQEEARRAFVATASHELRTPLASLDGMLELLGDDLSSGDPDLEDARALLERARAQSRRLARLAADLLDLSRLDAEVHLRSEPVELGELCRAVLAEFELGTEERGITSSLDDRAGPLWALGDPGSVARIVRILLDNAVRVSPPGGDIRVELHGGTRAAVTVCDRGPGVPSEERELIFKRFQRGREAGTEAGFGLGLAIGRELAERMGGQLVLDDVGGGGARFTLTLPTARAPESEPLLTK